MADLKDRLDKLKETIQQTDFLEGKGLSNEVNIRMFCYDAKDEMIIRYFVESLANENLSCNIHIVDLYEIFLSICEDKRILNEAPKLERKRGKDVLEKQLKENCDVKTTAKKIMSELSDIDDVLMIVGVGKAFPFIRVHSLLNAIQKFQNEKPIVVLYPGTFDGHSCKLFNRLSANPYYRAFNII